MAECFIIKRCPGQEDGHIQRRRKRSTEMFLRSAACTSSARVNGRRERSPPPRQSISRNGITNCRARVRSLETILYNNDLFDRIRRANDKSVHGGGGVLFQRLGRRPDYNTYTSDHNARAVT